MESHLLQMRGLKPFVELIQVINFIVASFTDAWIETSIVMSNNLTDGSHLLQMRGLKQ